jgi:hypothetical protein
MTATELRFGPYRIWEFDSRNICLEYDTGKASKDRDGNEKGETIKVMLGYYDSVSPAIKSAFRHGLKGQGSTSAKQLMLHIDETMRKIDRAVEKWATTDDAPA